MLDRKVVKILTLFICSIFILVLTSCESKTPDTTTVMTTTTVTETTAALPTTIVTDTTVLDPQLLGKWVEENKTQVFGLPYMSIEFFEDGTSAIGEDHGTYKIVDGQLQCEFDGVVYTGDYEINGTKLTIYRADGQFKVYIKGDIKIESDPELIGKWVEENKTIIFGLPYLGIEFFEDGTSVIGEDHGTYQIVDGQLQCTFDGVVYTGDYEINGTKLTIYRADGQFKVYIKEE